MIKVSAFWIAILLLEQMSFAQQILVKPYVQPGDLGLAHATDIKTIWSLTDSIPAHFRVEYSIKDQPSRAVEVHKTSMDVANTQSMEPQQLKIKDFQSTIWLSA